MKALNILIGLLLILSAGFAYAGGEKAGTEDINIGVGELQEYPGQAGAITGQHPAGMPEDIRVRPNSSGTEGSRINMDDEDGTKAPILVPGVQKPRGSYGYEKTKKGGNVETEWKVEEGE